jgi:integrase
MFFPTNFTISSTGFIPTTAPSASPTPIPATKSTPPRYAVSGAPRRGAVAPPANPFQPTMTPSMPFAEAARAFLASLAPLNAENRVQFLAPRTHLDMKYLVATLTLFFGETRLDAIHPGHLAAYQKARANGDGFTRWAGTKGNRHRISSPAGAAKINYELGLFRRIMIAACAWTFTMQKLYVPLQKLDIELPKALSEEEENRFLSCAASMAETQVIWWYSLVARHTCFSSDEMRTIRIGDINLNQDILGVNRRHGKNRIRRREIPLTDDKCIWALKQLIQRATELVGNDPHMYLFPGRIVRNHFDGTKPMCPTGLRKQFEDVRNLACVPWFCINGWRHTAITRMAEAGVPIAIIQRRAGHISPKMTEHYTHISEQVERREMMRMGNKNATVSTWDRSAAYRTPGALQLEHAVTHQLISTR